MLRAVLPWSIALLLGIAVAWLVAEGRRVAAIAGAHELDARAARADAAAAAAHADELAEQKRGLEAEVARLERELQAALANGQAVGEVLTQQVAELQRAEVQRQSAMALASVPPPTGVARCLATLRDCLLADGFVGLRFLSARELVDAELRQVEVLDTDADRGESELIVAGRMTATLDRTRGVLTLQFFDGTRRAAGLRAALPDGGYSKRFSPVTGAMLEERLPYLVRATGAYPEPPARPAVDPDAVDSATRAAWLERVDVLLAKAGTAQRLRLAGFRGLRDARFRSVRLLGYDRGEVLVLTADCDTLAVEVDDAAGIVSLLLQGGVLRRNGGDSTIGQDGYRMLLPDVTPKQATETMLGMVVHR